MYGGTTDNIIVTFLDENEQQVGTYTRNEMSFEITDIPYHQSGTLYVLREGYTTFSQSVSNIEADQTINPSLDPVKYDLSGTVTTDGEASGFTVTYTPSDGQAITTQTDESGAYMFEDKVPYTQTGTISVSKDGYTTATQAVTKTTGDATYNITCNLNQYKLTGTIITDPEGLDKSGFKLTLQIEGETSAKTFTTQSDGTFEIGGIKHGSKATLTTTKDGFVTDVKEFSEAITGEITYSPVMSFQYYGAKGNVKDSYAGEGPIPKDAKATLKYGDPVVELSAAVDSETGSFEFDFSEKEHKIPWGSVASITIDASGYESKTLDIKSVKADIDQKDIELTPITFTITYDKGSAPDQKAMQDQTVHYDDPNGKASDNLYEGAPGFQFDGWSYKDKTYTKDDLVSTLTTIAGDKLTFTATWSQEKYKVNLKVDPADAAHFENKDKKTITEINVLSYSEVKYSNDKICFTSGDVTEEVLLVTNESPAFAYTFNKWEQEIEKITRTGLDIQANFDKTDKTYSISGNIYITNIPEMEEDFPMGGLYVQYNSSDPKISKDPSSEADGSYVIENVPYDAVGKTLTMKATGYRDIEREEIVKVEGNVEHHDLYIDYEGGEIQPIEYKVIYDKNSETASGEMDASEFTYEDSPKLSKMSFTNPSANFLG